MLRFRQSALSGPITPLPLATEHPCVPLFPSCIYLTQDLSHSNDNSLSWVHVTHPIPQYCHQWEVATPCGSLHNQLTPSHVGVLGIH